MKPKFELREENYQYLFDNASDAMWVHDMDGNILVANKACEKLTGYVREEFVGVNVARFLPGEFLDTAREVKRRLLKGEEIEQPYEQQLVRKDGTTRVVKMAASLVVIDGEIAGFQHVARDVTEEKKLEGKLRFYVQQITRVQEDERKRLARQLHDEASPPLLLLLQRLDAIASAAELKSPSSLRKNLGDLRNQVTEALEGLRRAAQDLRPRIVDDLGLIPALEWMAEDLTKNHGVDAYVKVQ